MSRTKIQKKEIIEKLSKIMDGAKSIVFVNFHGLKVLDATTMRRAMRKDGVSYFVAKKSLTARALAEKKYSGTMPELVGESGIAYSTDLIAPARNVYEFQKKFKDQVSIIGGVFDGAYMDKAGMISIASIPSLDTLRGMFVNVINSPIQGFVMALDQIAKKNK
ncbi:MAG: 50S ribosomal protein L10 [Candidatus Taylorbacteria bacterium]